MQKAEDIGRTAWQKGATQEGNIKASPAWHALLCTTQHSWCGYEFRDDIKDPETTLSLIYMLSAPWHSFISRKTELTTGRVWQGLIPLCQSSKCNQYVELACCGALFRRSSIRETS